MMEILTKGRTCSRCKQVKPHQDFSPLRHGSSTLRSCCRTCHSDDVTRRADEKKAMIAEYKIKKGCQDCGEMFIGYPGVLEYDHRTGETKLFDVSMGSGYGWELLTAEILKCDVVCANCHRIRTARRRAGLLVGVH